jgi:hypothetical protein
MKKDIKRLDGEIVEASDTGAVDLAAKLRIERRVKDNKLLELKSELADDAYFAQKVRDKPDQYFNSEKMKWLDADDDNETINEYIAENVIRKNHGGWPLFRDSVKEQFKHPMRDVDADWMSFTTVDAKVHGGKPEQLSRNKIERMQQRGAAITANVISQANVEPLIDHGRDSSLREVMTDVMFGRQTGKVKKR